MIDVEKNSAERVRQGDIYRNIEYIEYAIEEYGIIDISKTFNNFSDTAAAIENTDLIISNDSSLAHLAGAMGKKCFVLLPYIYNWRWHKDLSSCDWYESVEIFRQKTPNDWQEVMNRVKIRVEEIKNER